MGQIALIRKHGLIKMDRQIQSNTDAHPDNGKIVQHPYQHRENPKSAQLAVPYGCKKGRPCKNGNNKKNSQQNSRYLPYLPPFML